MNAIQKQEFFKLLCGKAAIAGENADASVPKPSSKPEYFVCAQGSEVDGEQIGYMQNLTFSSFVQDKRGLFVALPRPQPDPHVVIFVRNQTGEISLCTFCEN